ncbi:hypothetical protein AGMMS49928_29160 [Spirochaetia bacterium]|nr:hypothetical protein AGMMS49928_29160 [Spirochaetia bacterium]
MLLNIGNPEKTISAFRKWWRKEYKQEPVKYEDLPEDIRLCLEGKIEEHQVKNPREFYKAEDGCYYKAPNVLF